MSIEYSLLIDSSEPLNDFVQRLREFASMSVVESTDSRYVLSGTGVTCYVTSQTELGRQLVREIFGIETIVDIVFRLDKFQNLVAGMGFVVKTCKFFLVHDDCDLVLLSNGERGLLLRKAGKVTIDVGDPYWKETWRLLFDDICVQKADEALPSL